MANSRVLIFSVKASVNNTDYYCMLLYALNTLYNNTPRLGFDVIVYYDIDTLCFSDMHYDATTLYPDVIFIQKVMPKGIYDRCIPNPKHYYKWLCLEDIIKYSSYHQIAYFDCDVIFLADLNKIFDKYNGSFYGLFEGYDALKIDLIGTPHGMSSGQFIFNREILLNIDHLFYKVISQGGNLCRIINSSDKDDSHKTWLNGLNEQYAGHKVLINHDISLDQISTRHVKYGPSTCDIAINGLDIAITNVTTQIIHYTNYNAFIFVPSRFRNAHLNELYNRNIKNNKLNRSLWG